jgi:hypothetical protein
VGGFIGEMIAVQRAEMREIRRQIDEMRSAAATREGV